MDRCLKYLVMVSLFSISGLFPNANAALKVVNVPYTRPVAAKTIQRFFVEVEGDPILSFKRKQLDKGFSKVDVKAYRSNLDLKRQQIKVELNQQNLGAKIVREMDLLLNGFVIEGPDDQIAEVLKIKGVTNITRVTKVSVPETEIPRDIRQLGDQALILPPLDVQRIWEQFGATGKGRTIAVIDTGVDYTHPDLGGCFGPGCKVVAGYDYVNKDSDPLDDNKHGTHVAGIAAGNGVMRGVAPDAKIFAYKVLDDSGDGYSDDIIQAIEKSVDPNGDGDDSDAVDVINLSLGGAGDSFDPLSRAVNNAASSAVVVCAAGNSGANVPIGSPAAARESIAVAATDGETQLATFSNIGPTTDFALKPDIAAPGVNIRSTLPDGAYGILSGTSMASPYIAGLSVLLLEKNKISKSLSASSIVKTRLAVSAKNLLEADKTVNAFAKQGHGLVQPFATVESGFEIYQFRFNEDTETDEGPDLRTQNLDDGYLLRRAVVAMGGKIPSGKSFRIEVTHDLGDGADIRLSKTEVNGANVREPLVVFIRQKISMISQNQVYPNGNGLLVKFIDNSNSKVLTVPVSVFLRGAIKAAVQSFRGSIQVISSHKRGRSLKYAYQL